MESKKQNSNFNKEILVNYKNQAKPVKGQLFTDPLFPPNDNSLLAQNANGEYIDKEEGPKRCAAIETAKIEWKRASEIFPKYLLFEDSISVDDIKQGKLGNCYFLSALASMCEYPKLVYQIFKTRDINPDGFYEVVLFIDGRYQIVVVDDYFPVYKGTNIVYFAKPNKNELWVMLLEKVWAKVNGGYLNIISGWPSDPLKAFTGFSTDKVVHDNFQPDEVWDEIKKADKLNSILCTSTRNDETLEKKGLIKNHAYTLIETFELNSKGKVVKLCKIRNPWGHKEWTGDWSDHSPLWGEEEKKQLEGFESKDDGSFWMCLEDFVIYYVRTDICYVMYDCNVKYFEINTEDSKLPNVFNFYLNKNSKVNISLNRKYWRYNRELSNSPHPATLLVMRYDPKTFALSKMIATFDCYDECSIYKIFNSGYYIVCAYQNYEHSKEPKPDGYIIKIASPSNFKYIHAGLDKSFELFKEMFIQAILEKKKNEIKPNEIFQDISNNFKKSGIGYRIVYNPFSTSYEKWNNNSNEVQHMFLLPPYKQTGEFEMIVPPEKANIILGMREDNYGAYTFKINSTKTTFSCKAKKDPTKTKMIQLEDYCNVEVANQSIKDPNYYDFTSTGVKEAKEKLEFESIDAEKVMIEDLEKKEPVLMKHILALKPVDDETQLQWCYIVSDNGIYVGQAKKANKEGRGAFRFTEDQSCWVGYWSKNQKNGMGYSYNKKMKLTFEGMYEKNQRQGKGKLYFSTGDYYEGDFKKNKRTGNGVYYWKDKSKWEGPFLDNEMNGKGKYTDTEGQSWETTYENGSLVE